MLLPVIQSSPTPLNPQVGIQASNQVAGGRVPYEHQDASAAWQLWQRQQSAVPQHHKGDAAEGGGGIQTDRSGRPVHQAGRGRDDAALRSSGGGSSSGSGGGARSPGRRRTAEAVPYRPPWGSGPGTSADAPRRRGSRDTTSTASARQSGYSSGAMNGRDALPESHTTHTISPSRRPSAERQHVGSADTHHATPLLQMSPLTSMGPSSSSTKDPPVTHPPQADPPTSAPAPPASFPAQPIREGLSMQDDQISPEAPKAALDVSVPMSSSLPGVKSSTAPDSPMRGVIDAQPAPPAPEARNSAPLPVPTAPDMRPMTPTPVSTAASDPEGAPRTSQTESITFSPTSVSQLPPSTQVVPHSNYLSIAAPIIQLPPPAPIVQLSPPAPIVQPSPPAPTVQQPEQAAASVPVALTHPIGNPQLPAANIAAPMTTLTEDPPTHLGRKAVAFKDMLPGSQSAVAAPPVHAVPPPAHVVAPPPAHVVPPQVERISSDHTSVGIANELKVQRNQAHAIRVENKRLEQDAQLLQRSVRQGADKLCKCIMS